MRTTDLPRVVRLQHHALRLLCAEEEERLGMTCSSKDRDAALALRKKRVFRAREALDKIDEIIDREAADKEFKGKE